MNSLSWDTRFELTDNGRRALALCEELQDEPEVLASVLDALPMTVCRDCGRDPFEPFHPEDCPTCAETVKAQNRAEAAEQAEACGLPLNEYLLMSLAEAIEDSRN